MNHDYLLESIRLNKVFAQSKSLFNWHPRSVKAVNDVSFGVKPKEVLGLVGESGCGKSTLGRTILRLLPASSGQVLYRGQDLLTLPSSEMFQMRKKLQIIFQDVYSSLNPRMTVEDIITAPLDVFKEGSRAERRERVVELLNEVGLSSHYLNRFPHEFSGGQRQRLVIARALILNPELVVCDEPVSALDVSVRAQVLNLMNRLQRDKGLTYLFISHDLSVVKHISDRIAVMYLGKIVELADRDELFSHPAHPYTGALLSAIPLADTKKRRKRVILQGDIPNPYHPPTGCYFHTRCPKATERCKEEEPPLEEIGPGHTCACFYPDEKRSIYDRI